MQIDLSKYDNSLYTPGRGFLVRFIWYLINGMFFKTSLIPFSKMKATILRLFGAKVGKGVVLKPFINVKYPWNLEIGDYSWIGENVWIDSLASIKIGRNVCISQGSYLCTGSHDWTDPFFGLIVKSIIIEDGVWVGGKSTIAPGVTLKLCSVITLGSVVTKDTEPYNIYQGVPAISVGKRVIK